MDLKDLSPFHMLIRAHPKSPAALITIFAYAKERIKLISSIRITILSLIVI